MEKITELIDKLQELKNSQASLSTLSYYAQLLYAEIMHAKTQQVREQKTKSTVSVILPTGVPNPAKSESLQAPPVAAYTTSSNKAPAYETKSQSVNSLFEIPEKNGYPRKMAVVRELNETIAINQKSLNDLLKDQQTEVSEKLKAVPIKNLSGAIDINEKFQYIDNLFNGDQDMYERSVKTINAFSNLREAENWMERELRLKLGWMENNTTVQSFYSLVKMRFA